MCKSDWNCIRMNLTIIDGIVYTGNNSSIGELVKQLPGAYSNSSMERHVC